MAAIASLSDLVNKLTGGNNGWTKRISKAGAAFGAMTVTITEAENGWYSLTLSTSHTDTLGELSMTFIPSSGLQVNVQFNISARILDDLAYPTTSGRSMDVDASGGVEVGSFQASAITTAAFTAGAVNSTVAPNLDAAVSSRGTANAGDSMALTASERNSVADALLDRSNGIETGRTLRQAMRIIAAATGGAVSVSGTTVTFTGVDGSTVRVTGTVDSSGNRSGITYS